MTNFAHLAVIIGIDAYGDIPRLATAANEAARMAELLRSAYSRGTLLRTLCAEEVPRSATSCRGMLAPLYNPSIIHREAL